MLSDVVEEVNEETLKKVLSRIVDALGKCLH